MSPSCSDSLSRGCIVLNIDAAPFHNRRLNCSAGARHIRANDCRCPRQMNRELWAIAPNTHERYLDSCQGRVRNARTALTLKVRVGTRGYEYVLLCLPECRAVYRTVHRLTPHLRQIGVHALPRICSSAIALSQLLRPTACSAMFQTSFRYIIDSFQSKHGVDRRLLEAWDA